MSLKRMPSVGKSLMSRIFARSSATSMTDPMLDGPRPARQACRRAAAPDRERAATRPRPRLPRRGRPGEARPSEARRREPRGRGLARGRRPRPELARRPQQEELDPHEELRDREPERPPDDVATVGQGQLAARHEAAEPGLDDHPRVVGSEDRVEAQPPGAGVEELDEAPEPPRRLA